MDVLPRAVALGTALLLLGCSSSGGDAAARPAASAPPAATAPAGSPPSGPDYLALGDSVAAGTGARLPTRNGYVPVLAELLAQRAGCDGAAVAACDVRVRNLAVPGATTQTLVRDQLPEAVEVLRQGGVDLVTVTVGGNDVFAPVLRACAPSPTAPACTSAAQASVGQVDRGVDRLLAELTAAADPAATVAVMTYYDPLGACRLRSLQPLAGQVLEGTDATAGLNDVLRSRAAQHGAVVVETAGALTSPDDFVGGLDCLHPSTGGHERLARAFADAVPGTVLGADAAP